MRRSALIIVAAGPQQLLVIRKAREMGFAVIAVDRNPEAPGFAYASDKIHLSTYEPEPIIAQLRALADSVDCSSPYDFQGVITRSSGLPVITTATIAQAFELPGVAPEVARTVVFKSKFMARCTEAGIPAPKHQVACHLEEIAWEQIEYPCVLKPSLGLVGQQGVQIAHGPQELRVKFAAALQASYEGWVEIESWVPGRDVILMAMASKGSLIPVVLLDEINVVSNSGRIKRQGIAIPSAFTGTKAEERIHQLAQDIVTTLGIGTTPFLLSCRCEDEGLPRVIEVHLDLGADRILDELLPASTDFDFVGFAIQIMTGRRPSVSSVEPLSVPSISFSPRKIIFEGNGEAHGSRRWRLEVN